MLRSADDGIALAYERSPLLGKKSKIIYSKEKADKGGLDLWQAGKTTTFTVIGTR